MVRVACFDAPVGHHILTPSLCASLTKGRQPLLNRASTPHNDNYSTLYTLSISHSCHNYNFYFYFYSPPPSSPSSPILYGQKQLPKSFLLHCFSLILSSLSTTTTTQREEPAANKRTPTRRKLNKSQDTIILYYYIPSFFYPFGTHTNRKNILNLV